MKVRHFNTAFRASLFFFVALCSSVVFSDGTCELIQEADGTFRIICEGGRIDYITEYQTNWVYIVENCEALKFQLLNTVDRISSGLSSSLSLYDIDGQIHFLRSYGSDMEEDTNFQSSLDTLSRDYDELKDRIEEWVRELDGDLSTADPPRRSLAQQIADIECGSCSTNSGGSSCCDFTPVLEKLNIANSSLFFITNSLGSFVGGNNTARYFRNEAWSGGSLSIDTALQPLAVNAKQISIVNMLKLMHSNLAYTQASLNNYFYQLTQFQMLSVTNNLEILTSASTNHFSLFRDMTFQDSPLIDYSQQSKFDSYYDFLTNHYLKVSFGQYNDLLGDEKSKTNWFSRIETLLASLVFYDSDGTNTVDDTYGKSQQNNLINSLDGMETSSRTQVNLMSDMGDNLLASLRSLNSSFSAAVSMPGEVTLASVGSNASGQVQYLKFQSSEISQLVEACRCATTLAWCIGGIWLLFLFVSWSIKTSYSLCVFCWSVVSAIFGGGKT